jgi:hypothetical protein
MAGQDMRWPDLPSKGYLAGRPASLGDAKAGNAVFSMDGGSKGALPVAIPQYVLWKDEQGTSHPMILVQAERAPDGSDILGLRDLVGGEMVVTMPEVTLLGTEKPN